MKTYHIILAIFRISGLLLAHLVCFDAEAFSDFEKQTRYYIDSTGSFLPVQSPVNLRPEIGRPVAADIIPWVVTDIHSSSSIKLALLVYKEPTEIWLDYISDGQRVCFKWNERRYNRFSFIPEELNRSMSHDSLFYDYTNHYLLPIHLPDSSHIRIWSKPKINLAGNNDWRVAHVFPYSELDQAETFNLVKFSFYASSTFILIVFAIVLSIGGSSGVIPYAVLCLCNLILVIGAYPGTQTLVRFFEAYLFPHYYILPLIFMTHFYLAARFFNVLSHITKIFMAVLLFAFGTTVVVFHVWGIAQSNALLSVLNTTIMIVSLPYYFWLVRTSRRTDKPNPGSGFMVTGVVVSHIGVVITTALHLDFWFSLWFGGYDYSIAASFIEQMLIGIGVLRLLGIQTKQKAIAEHSLMIEKGKVNRLTQETVKLEITLSEKDQAVSNAIELLKSFQSSGTKEADSSTVLSVIRMLDKYSKNSRLFDSVKLLIDEKEPDFRAYLNEKYSHLTAGEVRLMELYYLELQNKEVANLMNVGLNGLYVTKNRLKKKLNLPKGISLETFLNKEIRPAVRTLQEIQKGTKAI